MKIFGILCIIGAAYIFYYAMFAVDLFGEPVSGTGKGMIGAIILFGFGIKMLFVKVKGREVGANIGRALSIMPYVIILIVAIICLLMFIDKDHPRHHGGKKGVPVKKSPR